MNYNSIIIIGFGKIAEECFDYVVANYSSSYKIDLIIYENHLLSRLPKITAKYDIIPFISSDKKIIKNYLLTITENTLIVSANNNYIFPDIVVGMPNLTIVNFHNSLLPHHRGRNASTWSIFEQNDITGVTWHIVDSRIDNGDIVFQKEIPIEKDETALGLIQKGQVVGIKGFEEFLPKLLDDSVSIAKQKKLEDYIVHYSKDVPNNGILDTNWKIEKISAFLRSLDLGPLPFFDRFIHVDGEKLYIKGYKINPLSTSGNKKSISYSEEEVRITENDLNIRVFI